MRGDARLIVDSGSRMGGVGLKDSQASQVSTVCIPNATLHAGSGSSRFAMGVN